MINTENHPCFNAEKRLTMARVHLPVASRCNVQCNFCNRQFDCINESRPGITSALLKPDQALGYLHEVAEKLPNVSVVGIAGPGDPMANPEETLETLSLVRADFPDMLLCIATNGLNLAPYLGDLDRLKVSHVTITVNAVDPEISVPIYQWLRYNKRSRNGPEATEYLWEQQKHCIRALDALGILVKINSIIIPGINDRHIPKIAATCASLGARYFNAMPLRPVAGTPFGGLEHPSGEKVRNIQRECSAYLPQMAHCSRCRADAAGIIGEENSAEVTRILRSHAGIPEGRGGASSCGNGSSVPDSAGCGSGLASSGASGCSSCGAAPRRVSRARREDPGLEDSLGEAVETERLLASPTSSVPKAAQAETKTNNSATSSVPTFGESGSSVPKSGVPAGPVEKASGSSETPCDDGETAPKPLRAAVATWEGSLVNLHLGHAEEFVIFEYGQKGWEAVDSRLAPVPGGGDARWTALAELLEDCQAVFVSGAGKRPQDVLAEKDIRVFVVEGIIDNILADWARGLAMGRYLRHEVCTSGKDCGGTGNGCG